MVERKREIQIKFYVTEQERILIEEKMKLFATSNLGAYLRKMAIDGYIIQVDYSAIKEQTENRCEHQPDSKAYQFHRERLRTGHKRD